MEVKKESNIKGYPKAISYLCMQKIANGKMHMQDYNWNRTRYWIFL